MCLLFLLHGEKSLVISDYKYQQLVDLCQHTDLALWPTLCSIFAWRTNELWWVALTPSSILFPSMQWFQKGYCCILWWGGVVWSNPSGKETSSPLPGSKSLQCRSVYLDIHQRICWDRSERTCAVGLGLRRGVKVWWPLLLPNPRVGWGGVRGGSWNGVGSVPMVPAESWPPSQAWDTCTAQHGAVWDPSWPILAAGAREKMEASKGQKLPCRIQQSLHWSRALLHRESLP